MRELPLNHGYVTLVDKEDFNWISQRKWYYHKGYAVRTERVNGKKKMVYLHRVIMNPPKGFLVDHINGDKLCNLRSNLRICTHAQNMQNMHRTTSRKRANKASQFKGVYWVPSMNKWVAQIRIDGSQKHLGYFTDEIEAAQAYDRAAFELFREFARPNFDNEGGKQICPNSNMKLLSRTSSQKQNGRTLGAAII